MIRCRPDLGGGREKVEVNSYICSGIIFIHKKKKILYHLQHCG